MEPIIQFFDSLPQALVYALLGIGAALENVFPPVPADTFVYFQLLDANGMMVQSMRSGTIVRPGENIGCVGCHEEEKTAPACAGCHSLITQGDLPERACNICHAGPEPASLDRLRSQFESMDDFRPLASAVGPGFASSEIPESVTMDSCGRFFFSSNF